MKPNAIIHSIIQRATPEREDLTVLVAPDAGEHLRSVLARDLPIADIRAERSIAVINQFLLGKQLLEEHQLLSEEYDASYRANGPKARGRRRGLRFRIAEISKEPAFRNAWQEREYLRDRALRASPAFGLLHMMSAVNTIGMLPR